MDVGIGHWIFAAIFTVAFIIIMYFLYQADGKSYSKTQFKNVKSVTWIVAGSIFLLILFKIAYRLITKNP